MCCDLIAILPVHYFQRLPTFPCLQTWWNSVHGTKMYVTIQYVYIVTRGFEFTFISVIHLILSRSRHTTLAFNSFWSIFGYNGGFSSYCLCKFMLKQVLLPVTYILTLNNWKKYKLAVTPLQIYIYKNLMPHMTFYSSYNSWYSDPPI